MSQQTVIDKKLVIKSVAHDGYRRAGMAFNTGENILAAGTVTCSQLAMLEADPRLAVSYAQADTADGTAGNVVQGSEHDGLGHVSELSLLDAIGKLDPENSEHFTCGNKPQVNALEKLTGISLTAKERDEAWAEFQKLAANAE